MSKSWIDVRKASDEFEPEWEADVALAASRIFRRLYHLSTGTPFPDGERESRAAMSIIDGEIRKLVSELTEHWY